MRPITLGEVSKHSYIKDAEIDLDSSFWFVIHNNVYDVTEFLSEHPGGEEVLLKYAGRDATKAFESVGHSKKARKTLETLKIGYLPINQKNTTIGPCCVGKQIPLEPTPINISGAPRPPPPHGNDSSSFKWWWLLPLLVVLGGAFMARKKFKGE